MTPWRRTKHAEKASGRDWRFIALPGECERIAGRAEEAAVKSTLYVSTYFTWTYEEMTIPCTIKDGKLQIATEYTVFEWLEGDSGDTEDEPYDGDGEPHAVRAVSSDGKYILDLTILSPAAKELLRLGLVEGAPKLGRVDAPPDV
jgi:hypothetical protein